MNIKEQSKVLRLTDKLEAKLALAVNKDDAQEIVLGTLHGLEYLLLEELEKACFQWWVDGHVRAMMEYRKWNE